MSGVTMTSTRTTACNRHCSVPSMHKSSIDSHLGACRPLIEYSLETCMKGPVVKDGQIL